MIGQTVREIKFFHINFHQFRSASTLCKSNLHPLIGTSHPNLNFCPHSIPSLFKLFLFRQNQNCHYSKSHIFKLLQRLLILTFQKRFHFSNCCYAHSQNPYFNFSNFSPCRQNPSAPTSRAASRERSGLGLESPALLRRVIATENGTQVLEQVSFKQHC